MRTFVKILFTYALLVVQPYAVASDDALNPSEYKRDKNPPEVEALIGKQFPRSGISGWSRSLCCMAAGGLLGISPQPGLAMGVVLLERTGKIIFVIDLIDQKDLSTTVLDAQILPRQPRYDKSGNLIGSEKENVRLYSFTYACESIREVKVVGTVRPEQGREDCGHWSKQVQRAWKIDKQTGHITEISTAGISCRAEAIDECVNN
jgi:hypothetical protein